MNRNIFLLLLALLYGCGGSKQIIESPLIEERNLDTLVVYSSQPAEAEIISLEPYNAAYERSHDLLHTKLDLRFDMEQQQVIGKAWLTLTPYFYSTDRLRLDAKNFEFNALEVVGSDRDVQYDYNGKELTILLDKGYKKGEKFVLFIDYIATPRYKTGSTAITSEQGLFFINPLGEESDKPTQIWTQGETEYNSRWFPTIDKPNERCTQEMIITVNDKFVTLSNGRLVSSNKNKDGTRTDYWKMEQPHAPYLFMLAVGDFAVVKDNWNEKEIGYYVEHEYQPYAREIFSNTPEMLEFFSNILRVKYPWDKFSQVAVRDYVSGAMENTTGVIYGEFVQKTGRELIDNHNERIVAHEMFHHWFGDLVTCESWANLTLNEGFANYSEYLWFEHKYGQDAAGHLLIGDAAGYLNATSRGEMHPLIHFQYEDKDNMFDSHSYNKGGCVLHMLRTYLGDEAFFASLKKYLEDNAYNSAEAHDLRLAFEAVTGKDLNWFFNQWFFESGHPVLNINYDYDEISGKAKVIIEQTQDPGLAVPIFILPLKLDLYLASDLIMRQEVEMNRRKQEFEFEVPNKPILINVDTDKSLLAIINDNKNEEALAFQYFHAPRYADRYEAIMGLRNNKSEWSEKVMKAALNDRFWYIRGEAIRYIKTESPEITLQLKKMAKEDKQSRVRAAALDKLSELNHENTEGLAVALINDEQPYSVVASALLLLGKSNIDLAMKYAKGLESETNGTVLSALSQFYLRNPRKDHLPFFESALKTASGFNAINVAEGYAKIIIALGMDPMPGAADQLFAIASDMSQSPWKRYGATKALSDINGALKENSFNGKQNAAALSNQIRIKIEEIKKAETNPRLKSMYSQS